jgi:hypothetical protein
MPPKDPNLFNLHLDGQSLGVVQQGLLALQMSARRAMEEIQRQIQAQVKETEKKEEAS